MSICNELNQSHYYRDIDLEGNVVVEAIEDLEERVDVLEVDMTDAKEDIEELKNRPQTQEKKYLIIGDSYAAGELEPGSSWAVTLSELLGEDKCTIKARGGAGFTWSDTYAFSTLVAEAITGWTQDEKDAITDIVICGGQNDIVKSSLSNPPPFPTVYTQAEIEAAVTTQLTTIHNLLPKAMIHIGEIGNSLRTDVFLKGYRNCVAAYQNIASKMGFHYLANVEYVMHDYRNIWDTQHLVDPTQWWVHPNLEGNKKIARAVYEALMFGAADFHAECIIDTENAVENYGFDYPETTIVTSVDNDIAAFELKMNSFWGSGDSVFMRIGTRSSTVSGGSAGIPIKILEFGPKTCFMGESNMPNNVVMTTAMFSRYNGDTLVAGPMMMPAGVTVMNGCLYVIPSQNINEGASPFTWNRLHLMPVTITMPTLSC